MAIELSSWMKNVMESITKDECKTMMFLASDLLPGPQTEDGRAALIAMATSTTQSHLSEAIFTELLFHMKRFDILKNIMRKNRKQVEEGLKNCCIISQYRVLMQELSESLVEDEFRSLIFLLNDKIPKSRANHISSFIDIVRVLEERDEVSSSNLKLIEECLRNIKRNDLIKKIQAYKPAHEKMKLSVCASRIQDPVVEYNMKYDVKGVCVIIDYIGSDEVLLKNTFEQLGFVVFQYILLDEHKMYTILNSISQNAILQQAAVFICCLVNMEPHVFSTDAQRTCQETPISSSSITSVNTYTKLMEVCIQCVMLRKKPKLFFTQTRQSYQEIETDSLPINHPTNTQAEPTTEDVLWSACESSVQNGRDQSSVYFQILCSTLLYAQNRGLSVLDALTEVDRKIQEHNQINPDKTYRITLTHTLSKILYL